MSLTSEMGASSVIHMDTYIGRVAVTLDDETVMVFVQWEFD